MPFSLSIMSYSLSAELSSPVLKTKESKSIQPQDVACLQNSACIRVASHDWRSSKGRCCLPVQWLIQPQPLGVKFHRHSWSLQDIPAPPTLACPEITASRRTDTHSHTYVSLHITVHAQHLKVWYTHTQAELPMGQLCLDTEGKKTKSLKKQLNSESAYWYNPTMTLPWGLWLKNDAEFMLVLAGKMFFFPLSL